MVSIGSNGQKIAYGIKHYNLDSEDDLPLIQTRNEIVEAIAAGATTEQEINSYMNRIFPDPDIVIRTNNIRRVSNFMLWQISYSELFFLEPYFPDLTMEDLDSVIEEFNNKRERYYGGY